MISSFEALHLARTSEAGSELNSERDRKIPEDLRAGQQFTAPPTHLIVQTNDTQVIEGMHRLMQTAIAPEGRRRCSTSTVRLVRRKSASKRTDVILAPRSLSYKISYRDSAAHSE
ncbi:hypothetical protein PoB_006594100 [Plakobranchus ocellatus]|uniref:Uncharacterized protein n=1 Tax=Plakobranchus ocellatus TaxID=259542 RepID=A0AAV4D670_9GAST|nr:hypothetical protein PoB_006594100 [Plakobranchus ocellatus]